jgi:hypothetical protein
MYIKNLNKKNNRCKIKSKIKPLNILIQEIEDLIKNSGNYNVFFIKKPIWSK